MYLTERSDSVDEWFGYLSTLASVVYLIEVLVRLAKWLIEKVKALSTTREDG